MNLTRPASLYTFIRPSRRKPTSVMPASSASSAASVLGADTAASMGMPAIHAFWSAYCHASVQPPALPRTVELTAVRLLQIALERAQWLASASAHVVSLMQLADNMLRSPHDAARGLLGLRA